MTCGGAATSAFRRRRDRRERRGPALSRERSYLVAGGATPAGVARRVVAPHQRSAPATRWWTRPQRTPRNYSTPSRSSSTPCADVMSCSKNRSPPDRARHPSIVASHERRGDPRRCIRDHEPMARRREAVARDVRGDGGLDLVSRHSARGRGVMAGRVGTLGCVVRMVVRNPFNSGVFVAAGGVTLWLASKMRSTPILLGSRWQVVTGLLVGAAAIYPHFLDAESWTAASTRRRWA